MLELTRFIPRRSSLSVVLAILFVGFTGCQADPDGEYCRCSRLDHPDPDNLSCTRVEISGDEVEITQLQGDRELGTEVGSYQLEAGTGTITQGGSVVMTFDIGRSLGPIGRTSVARSGGRDLYLRSSSLCQ